MKQKHENVTSEQWTRICLKSTIPPSNIQGVLYVNIQAPQFSNYQTVDIEIESEESKANQ